MNRKLIAVAGALAIPAVLWVAGQVFGYGVSFDKPSVLQTDKVLGPGAKGSISYIVHPPSGMTQPWAVIRFTGQCTTGHGPSAVTHEVITPPEGLNVTTVTNYNSFAGATPADISRAVDDFYVPILVDPKVADLVKDCWPGAKGIVVQNIDGPGVKDPLNSSPTTAWDWHAGATLKGVF